MISSALVYILNWGITFFLTPYIVDKLGIAAYGFVGLSNNIIGYTLLITVALNSMASRYIALNYHRKDYNAANEYLSSTFYANICFAGFIFLIALSLTFFLEKILHIPHNLISDVKTLFLLLFINACISLIIGVYNVSTFIKNRLDWSNARTMIGSIIRCLILVTLFSLFRPKLWYFGVTAIIMTAYVLIANLNFFKRLTPELIITFSLFKVRRALQIMRSGAWNLISSLSILLNEGFDLLLANLFIGPVAMGLLSVSKSIPSMITSFIVSLSSSFHPSYMKFYAENNMEELKGEIQKSIRILGFVSVVPLAIVFAFGRDFFQVWMPEENSILLYRICIVSSLLLIFALPYQSIWFIFILDDKIKQSSLNALLNSLMTFVVVLIGIIFIEDKIIKLFILVSTRTVFSSIRCLTFLPFYAASILNFPRIIFFKPILKNLLLLALVTPITIAIGNLFHNINWPIFILKCCISCTISIVLGYYVILTFSDREFLLSKLRDKLHLNHFSR